MRNCSLPLSMQPDHSCCVCCAIITRKRLTWEGYAADLLDVIRHPIPVPILITIPNRK